MPIPKLLVPVILVTCVLAGAVQAQDDADRTIILGRTAAEEAAGERPGSFRQADILMLPDGQSVSAMRTDTTAAARYSFDIEDVPLTDLLGTLAGTLYAAPDYIQPAGSLDVRDDSAQDRTVTLDVERATLADTLDRAAIASGCNIYREDLIIVVDRCE